MAGDHQNGVANQPPPEVVVVMVPFLAHGHLNQLLHLSHLISAYNIPVHFVSTTTHLSQLRRRHHRLSPESTLIHFHDFPTPPFTSPPPTSCISFPAHLQPSFNSSLHLRRPVADLTLSLSHTSRRVAVVHDSLMSYVVQDVVSLPNVETYIFRPLSAFCTFFSHWEKMGKPFRVDPEILTRLPSPDGTISPEFLEFVKLQQPHMNSHVGALHDSSRVIEGKFIEYLEREEISGKTEQWAIGPFNPVQIAPHATDLKNRHKCLQWLDKQAVNSVIYVSFGTTTTLTEEQIKELAMGLEQSEQRFIWVLREADKGDVFSDENKIVALPNGFENRVEERGLVVRDWAPQMAILEHSSTGGFLSHCGWNSSMESLSMGVPMATFPMHSDQPRNAYLITDVLRVGVEVKDWGRREELVTAVEVEKTVRRLMESTEGEEVRRRAAELGGAVRRSVAEGGASRKEMESFISYIKRYRRTSSL